MENKLVTVLESRAKSIRFSSGLANNLWKASKVIMCGILIGSFDAWQVRYLSVGHFGVEAAILYQCGLMTASGIAAFGSLHDRNWSRSRNALSLLVTIPIATIADNVSFDLQTLRLYIIILPRTGFIWRSYVFGHTFLHPLANWVDLQTFAPGLIDGYVAAIIIGAMYVLIQCLWKRI